MIRIWIAIAICVVPERVARLSPTLAACRTGKTRFKNGIVPIRYSTAFGQRTSNPEHKTKSTQDLCKIPKKISLSPEAFLEAFQRDQWACCQILEPLKKLSQE